MINETIPKPQTRTKKIPIGAQLFTRVSLRLAQIYDYSDPSRTLSMC
jgi:hypothetical protein